MYRYIRAYVSTFLRVLTFFVPTGQLQLVYVPTYILNI